MLPRIRKMRCGLPPVRRQEGHGDGEDGGDRSGSGSGRRKPLCRENQGFSPLRGRRLFFRLHRAGGGYFPHQANREISATRQGSRRGGQPRQERVPGQHESRDPHADDGDSRLQRPFGSQQPVRPRAERIPGGHSAKWQRLARSDQRYSGSFPHRSGQVDSGKDRLPHTANRGRLAVDGESQGGQERPGPGGRLWVAASRDDPHGPRRASARSS